MKGNPIFEVVIDPDIKVDYFFLYQQVHDLLQKKFKNVLESSHVYLSRPIIYISNKQLKENVDNNFLLQINVLNLEEKSPKKNKLKFSGLDDFTHIEPLIDRFVEKNEKLFQQILIKKIESTVNQVAEVINFTQLDESWDELPEFEKLEDFLVKKFKLKGFSIKEESVLKWQDITESTFVYPIHHNNSTFYLLKHGKDEKKDFYQLMASLISKLSLVNHDSKEGIVDKKRAQTNTKMLNDLGVPLALFNQDQELILYNQQFTKMGLTSDQCFSIENDSIFERKGQHYKVVKKSFYQEENYLLIIFQVSHDLEEKTDANKKAPEDLGIISSSIAHELNNPLAGILAALSLILLDDIGGENEIELKEMKKSATRAKTLIETFLGFSRMNPQLVKNSSLEGALEQALSLLRFRLVESNLKLNIEKKLDENYLLNVNHSIFSMVFYLVLGDLLTLIGHEQLIHEKISEKELKILISNHSSGFSILVFNDFDFSNKLLNSKLIKHLLDLEGYHLLIEDQQIVIRKKLN